VIDAAGVAPRIEPMLPVGVRPRQLAVRTLLVGMLLTASDHRPAHLRRVHRALISLPEQEQRRLGVIADWRQGPHPLTYRQTERTFALVVAALRKDNPDGTPSQALQEVLDALLEASVRAQGSRPRARSRSTGPTLRHGRAPRHRRAATAPTARPPGGTAAATARARQTRRSSATTCKSRRSSTTSTASRSQSSSAASS